jgi:predicted ester cyclase
MSADQRGANTRIARRYVESLWGGGDLSLGDQLVRTDLVDHQPMPGQKPGRTGHDEVIQMVSAAFPDRCNTVLQTLAEGDRVAVFYRFEGTHAGDYMGVPASGRRVCFHAVDVVRIENGKVAELWHVEELLQSLQQVGAVQGFGI